MNNANLDIGGSDEWGDLAGLGENKNHTTTNQLNSSQRRGSYSNNLGEDFGYLADKGKLGAGATTGSRGSRGRSNQEDSSEDEIEKMIKDSLGDKAGSKAGSQK